MNWDKVIGQVAEEFEISYSEAYRVCMASWKFMREKIGSLRLRHMGPEEFKQVRRNFNMPSFGKFGVSDKRFENINRRKEIRLNWKKNHAENQENQADI